MGQLSLNEGHSKLQRIRAPHHRTDTHQSPAPRAGHLVAIETKLRMDARVDGDPDSFVFRPTCSCGWVGPSPRAWFQNRDDALVEGRVHLLLVTGCADALPAVPEELTDNRTQRYA